ncbi:YkgJ family cysteine cluster protein [Deinococcus arcticus]|uniref:Zinc/iron-chelating domain-containing protein n=1 Tax=Deinococcus arcticus TaxID=2136176 RepID=A0A2T3WD56_9DEIO|nr:YkgJ family cysteine cluster protein [Deinococcus arcticus]PTA69828.1 zinc/iron-chelating domain-containing protein [Deinococcus arcticus]
MTGSASSSDPVTAAVQHAYARYGRQARSWLDGYAQRGGQVYCGAGCTACCTMPIRVSLAEARIMAATLDAELARAVEAHARAAVANARTAPDEEEYVRRHRLQVGFCPILDRSTGGCSRYDARPTRCRDTFSALPARYCAAETWETIGPREQAEYQRAVARTPGTDGELHFIAPLEHLSEPVWTAASRAMRRAWGLEVWGDFWLLTTLAADERFMAAVQAGDGRRAWQVASGRGLSHRMLLEFAPAPR